MGEPFHHPGVWEAGALNALFFDKNREDNIGLVANRMI